MGELVHGELTDRILSAAISVHRSLGPGLLESAYKECLAERLRSSGLEVVRERAIPLTYEGLDIPEAYRADIIINGTVLVELKSVERLLPIHEAQILTYLKLSGIKVGLLINFNGKTLKQGIRRFIV